MGARKDSNSSDSLSSASAGQKTYKLQSSSSASRLIPKIIWKNRSKSASRNTSSTIPQWTSQGHCRWLSSTGRWYNLCDTSLLELTEIERTALKQIVQTRLQSLKLGCKIESPKQHSSNDKKRRPYKLTKKSLTTGMFDRKEKSNNIQSGLVFGTSLERCIENDRTFRKKLSTDAPNMQLRSSSTSHSSLLGKKLRPAVSCHSLSDILIFDDENHRKSMINYGYSESNESLDFEKRNRLFGKCDSSADLNSSLPLYNKEPNVPSIVQTCYDHLETYGLNTVGVFRVSSSKRRVRQLREDFDSGKPVTLNEETHPHDVAQLLKEYFKDIKEPLLSKELYSAFIASKKLKNRHDQREALQYLICLLPIANRDTLWSLLNFLNNVASHSEDTQDESGEILAGNKMDSYNLATVFGPNILRSYKSGGDKEYKVESVMRAEERSDVVRVVQTLIDHHVSLFMLNADLLDHVYLHIQQKDPSSVNSLLCVKSNHNDSEVDGEPFNTCKSSSVETITKDDSSEVNSPLGSSSSFNEILFVDADESRNGYPTRRGYSASHLPDKNRLQANCFEDDQRRRSSEDVNEKKSQPSTNLLSPDVSLRRLSSPEISNMNLPVLTLEGIQKSSTAQSSPEEPSKPILKNPTEHFKVFVIDQKEMVEKVPSEVQTVRFKADFVESIQVNRLQRPQVCHLLTMPQSAIMRLPKFTLSESTIEEDTCQSEEETKAPPANPQGVLKVPKTEIPKPAEELASQRRRTRPKNDEESSPTRTRKDFFRRRRVRDKSSSEGRKESLKDSESSLSGVSKVEGTDRKKDKKPEQWKRCDVISSESSSEGSKQSLKISAGSPSGVSKGSVEGVDRKKDKKPDQWKRWDIISSEHTETYV